MFRAECFSIGLLYQIESLSASGKISGQPKGGKDDAN
jgi:hypothetical protein